MYECVKKVFLKSKQMAFSSQFDQKRKNHILSVYSSFSELLKFFLSFASSYITFIIFFYQHGAQLLRNRHETQFQRHSLAQINSLFWMPISNLTIFNSEISSFILKYLSYWDDCVFRQYLPIVSFVRRYVAETIYQDRHVRTSSTFNNQ